MGPICLKEIIDILAYLHVFGGHVGNSNRTKKDAINFFFLCLTVVRNTQNISISWPNNRGSCPYERKYMSLLNVVFSVIWSRPYIVIQLSVSQVPWLCHCFCTLKSFAHIMHLCSISILIQPIFISVTSGTAGCLEIILLKQCFLADYNCIHIPQLFQRK
jgi:hypothetical protein